MKDPLSVGEEIHKVIKVALDDACTESQETFLKTLLSGTGILIVGSRGNGKRNIHQIAYEHMLNADFAELERRANLVVLDDVVLMPHRSFEITDYDPRGADRIKGPKGPRTKWGKLK